MSWRKNLRGAITDGARELAEALGLRRHAPGDYADEEPPRRMTSRGVLIAAARRTIAETLGQQTIVELNVTAVRIVKDGQQQHLGECRPSKLLPAHTFDLLLPHFGVLIDVGDDRLAEEVEHKQAWAEARGVHYIAPHEAPLLAAKLKGIIADAAKGTSR